ncbi:MAG: RING finger protein [Blastocatellia bacterium]
MQTNPPPAGSLCAICQSPLEPQGELKQCPECQSLYHADCWQENGGCAIYGCAQVPATEGRAALEIPAAYWGQEDKPCPSCGRQILAAAMRCRHCGAVFSSSRPEERSEFNKREEISARLPKLRRTAVLLFIFGALPCTALIAGVVGLIWYLANREAVNALPPLYAGLAKIGFSVGLGQSVLVALVLLFYSASHQA